MPPPPVPLTFQQKKDQILAELAVPTAEYTDASPKGSVDEEIRDLIDFVNALEGYVTTSSCAGRITVYAEGQKKARAHKDSSSPSRSRPETATTGGKGGGGRWLFVSHEPVDSRQNVPIRFSRSSQDSKNPRHESLAAVEPQNARFIRFAFEPMILHVMTASLRHARPLLSAAINARFRESGVQSLKNLDDTEACPMVAIRTTGGLSMQSIIGFVTSDEQGVDQYQPIMLDDQLQLLFAAANARFEANKEMIANFQTCLRSALEIEVTRRLENDNWEDPVTRKIRKRHEGLATRKDKNHSNLDSDTTDGFPEINLFSSD
ncbi:MAG: hypothetical protein Q9160_000345 [Pyrenula sp. 1 TL-2023]